MSASLASDARVAARQYAKLCDRRDFDDPALRALIQSILPERSLEDCVERKVWEYAMLALILDETGRLHDGTRALSVGAGDERICFWLANHVGAVVATDIYGDGRFAAREAQRSMLDRPAAHAPYPYREERLDVVWMDARTMSFEDDSFDVVFTLSSIEHFGGRDDVARSAGELGRVLKPGGIAVVVTDYLLRQHPLDGWPVELLIRAGTLGRKMRGAGVGRRVALAETFTRPELDHLIVHPSGLRPLQELDTSMSPETWADGRLVVRTARSALTSVCLVLEKPAGADNIIRR